LASDSVDLDELMAAAGQDQGNDDVDPLDALFHLAWDQPVRTRAGRVCRVRQVRASELEAMSARAREILEGLLQR